MVRLLMKGENVFDYDPSQASSAWPAGGYEATIEKVEESLSKEKKDPMLIITFKVYGMPGGPTKGQTISLKEYITAPPPDSGRKGSLWKLKVLADTLGLGEKFKTKTLRPKELNGKNLIVNLTVEESQQYGDQNRIDSYAKLERLTAVAPAEVDEEVPF